MKISAITTVALATVVSTLPTIGSAGTKVARSLLRARQDAAPPPPAGGLTDVDILQFALTLEWLEAVFYQDGFKRFPISDFQAAGLDDAMIASLQTVGATEFAHASFLQSAIAQAQIRPVQPCTYNFATLIPDATTMLVTATVLENVGVAAYLGAAPLIQDPAILQAAGSILTVEARHQTLLRVAGKLLDPIPQPFDISLVPALTPRAIFTLAAPFIASCPDGSNLAINPFPSLQAAPVTPDPSGSPVTPPGTVVQLTAPEVDINTATHCAFLSGGVPGGAVFVPLVNGQCAIPHTVGGVAFVFGVNAAPLDGVVKEETIVAGPTFLVVT